MQVAMLPRKEARPHAPHYHGVIKMVRNYPTKASYAVQEVFLIVLLLPIAPLVGHPTNISCPLEVLQLSLTHGVALTISFSV